MFDSFSEKQREVAIAALTISLTILLGAIAWGLIVNANRDVASAASGKPERCVFSAPGMQLCTWDYEGDPARLGLSEVALDPRIVCELPIAGGDDERVCAAHGGQALPAVSAPGAPEAASASGFGDMRHALGELADAQTLAALSHLIGDVPATCRTGLGIQTCSWSISDRLEGYPLIAALVEVEQNAELSCVLPLDGSPRAANSCEVTAM